MEGTGYEIVREINLPIRVTYQYYFPISKGNPGKISNQLASTILGKLMTIASRSANLSPTSTAPALNTDQLAKIQHMQQLRQQRPSRSQFPQTGPNVGINMHPLQKLQQQASQHSPSTPVKISQPEIKSQSQPQSGSQTQQVQDNSFRGGFFQSPTTQGSMIGKIGKGDGYSTIRNALNSINFGARNNVDYFKIFMANQVTDSELLLLKDSDLQVLFPKLGPRMRFRRWLDEYRREKSKENVMIELYGVNENGVIDDEKLDTNGEKYSTIVSIFKKLKIANWQVYFKNFVDNGVTDLMLPDIAEKDLENLIPQIGAKLIFRKYLLDARTRTSN